MSNRKLVLIGGGGHCKSVLDSVLSARIFCEVIITDSSLPSGAEILGCQVVGNDNVLPRLREEGYEAFITVGTVGKLSLSRKKLIAAAEKLGFNFPVICDPSAVISKSAVINPGTFVGKNAVINADAKIGSHCIINSGAIIEHECSVGKLSHIAVGAVLCGNSHIGVESFIGAGSTVIQGLKIGDRVVIGAGSTVLTNIGDDLKLYGLIKTPPPPVCRNT